MEYQQGGNALLPTVSDCVNSPILSQSLPTVSDGITLPTLTYASPSVSPSPIQNNDAVSQLKILREYIKIRPKLKIKGRPKYSSKLWPSKNKTRVAKVNKEMILPSQSQIPQQRKRKSHTMNEAYISEKKSQKLENGPWAQGLFQQRKRKDNL